MEFAIGEDLRSDETAIAPIYSCCQRFLRPAEGQVIEPLEVELAAPPEMHGPVPGVACRFRARNRVHGRQEGSLSDLPND